MKYAILLSGGKGLRLGTDMPKQYIRVQGKMVIGYSATPLILSAKIDALVIVAESYWQEEIKEELSKLSDKLQISKKFYFAEPGENRQLSILHALRIIEETGGAETVLIHDAARPCLKQEQIEALFAALDGYDGVMPVLPMKDTVYLSRDGRSVTKLLPRSEIFAGQAPELFLFRPYYEATKALLPDRILEIKGSTEPAVMAGLNIAMITGDEDNFKITTMPDLHKFEHLLQETT